MFTFHMVPTYNNIVGAGLSAQIAVGKEYGIIPTI